MSLEPLSASFDLTYLERYSSNPSLPQGQLCPRYYSFDGSPLPDLTVTSEEGAAVAIEKSHSSFLSGEWRECSIQHRVNIISKAARSLQTRSAEAAYLDTLETGRSFFSLVNHSLPKAVQTALWFCNSVSNINGTLYQSLSSQNIAFDSITPYGSVLCILPWNDPLVLFCWKVIPALLLGNSVIVKPSEFSTGSALLFAELLHTAGVPKDVLQLVIGRDTKAFNLLVSDQRVRSISMTGSSETAKYIQKHSCSFLRKLNFECGGKSAFIVPDDLNDAELIKCSEVLVHNMFYNQGQICSAPSLLVINSLAFSKILPIIKQLSTSFLPGNPFGLSQNVGQICTETVLSRTKSMILSSLENHLEVWTHPGLCNCDSERGKQCHPPTLIICKNFSEYLEHSFLHQEVFGPILTIVVSNSYEEMINIANYSPFGLASAVWSSNANTLFYFSSRIDSGIVHLNTWGDDDIGIPFAGVKDSGEAREKCLETFNQFSYKKVVHIALNRQKLS